MGMNRRQLLQTGSLGAIALTGAGVHAAKAAPALTSAYEGPGLYLYPAWGEPRLYFVADTGGMLEFHDPHSRALLWRQSPALGGGFAGRLAVS